MVQPILNFAGRLVQNESFRRGMATAAASVLIAGISEAWRPTPNA